MGKEKLKLSVLLLEAAKPEWDKAAAQNFVIEMARGTLEPSRFRNYMIQDYLYLIEYLEILGIIKAQLLSISAEKIDGSLIQFVENVIAETKRELNRVHIPNMEAIGIREDEARKTEIISEISDYTKYMKEQILENGPLTGLVLLLQCSWGYAYIGQTVGKKYLHEIEDSAYKSWFDAYACEDYTKANQKWIDIVDRLAEGKEKQIFVEIFVRCAKYETKLWEAL